MGKEIYIYRGDRVNNTPNANRKHIAIYGKTNVGKSSIINKILEQDISVVSEIPGTTTDPVMKAMELLPVGPVVFIDTAGINDKTELGELRVKRTKEMLKRTDFALYVMESNDIDTKAYDEAKENFEKYNIPYLTVINKIDTCSDNNLIRIKEVYKDAVLISSLTGDGIENLKGELIKRLGENEAERTILGDILPYNSKVIFVIPIDSEAPKGRIILPQVQCLRDCLDNGIKSYVVRDTELQSALEDIKDVDLVVTDSQAFKKVSEIVPKNIGLTSFSILYARHKGELSAFVDGTKGINELTKNSKILISECCTHNVSHEDIGRIKIPKLLNRYVGAELEYDFAIGHDFPEELDKYDLVIHCGGCMVNRKTVVNRVNYCREKNIAITNYGVILAYLNGILERSIEFIR